MATKIAVDFVCNVLRQNPQANNFGTIYDEMARAACRRSFHNLGYEELAQAGISFSLLETNELECIIAEAQARLAAERGSTPPQ